MKEDKMIKLGDKVKVVSDRITKGDIGEVRLISELQIYYVMFDDNHLGVFRLEELELCDV